MAEDDDADQKQPESMETDAPAVIQAYQTVDSNVPERVKRSRDNDTGDAAAAASDQVDVAAKKVRREPGQQLQLKNILVVQGKAVWNRHGGVRFSGKVEKNTGEIICKCGREDCEVYYGPTQWQRHTWGYVSQPYKNIFYEGKSLAELRDEQVNDLIHPSDGGDPSEGGDGDRPDSPQIGRADSGNADTDKEESSSSSSTSSSSKGDSDWATSALLRPATLQTAKPIEAAAAAPDDDEAPPPSAAVAEAAATATTITGGGGSALPSTTPIPVDVVMDISNCVAAKLRVFVVSIRGLFAARRGVSVTGGEQDEAMKRREESMKRREEEMAKQEQAVRAAREDMVDAQKEMARREAAVSTAQEATEKGRQAITDVHEKVAELAAFTSSVRSQLVHHV